MMITNSNRIASMTSTTTVIMIMSRALRACPPACPAKSRSAGEDGGLRNEPKK